jgi:ABC-2 type transport system permease protein
MRFDKAWIIGKREYLTRVKTKGFWLGTVALPLFLGAISVGPTLMMAKNKSDHRIAVVDTSGKGLGLAVEKALLGERTKAETRRKDRGEVRFQVTRLEPGPDSAAQRAELDRRVLDDKVDAWIWLTAESLEENRLEYHAENVSNPVTQSALKSRISEVVRDWRLRDAGLDAGRINELTRSLDLAPVRVSETGSTKESGLAGFAVAFGLFFILYTMILLYGTQIMQGVLEEKSSRVVEVLASAVHPTELMLGKIGGIGLVALTQLAVWMGTALLLSSPGLAFALAMLPEGVLAALSPLVIVHFFILFLIGFFIYSSIYAMIGAAFNSLQEAQQFASVAVILVVAPMFLLMPVINDPDSKMAVVASMIPFFTPLVMMLRVALKMPPLWQILTAYALCGLTIAGAIWVCARIYRVGILMYGKKPTLQELWRWVRYA